MWNLRNFQRKFASSYPAMCIVTEKQQKGHSSMSCSKNHLAVFLVGKYKYFLYIYISESSTFWYPQWKEWYLVHDKNVLLTPLHYKICTCETVVTQILSIPCYFCFSEVLWLWKLMICNTKHILYTFCVLVLTCCHIQSRRQCDINSLCYLILYSDMFLWVVYNS